MRNHSEPVNVRVLGDRDPSQLYRAAYLGMLGLVLDTDPAVFPVNTRLELEISLPDAAGATLSCRLFAVVSQYSALGVGLTYSAASRQTLTELSQIIFRSWRVTADPRREKMPVHRPPHPSLGPAKAVRGPRPGA